MDSAYLEIYSEYFKIDCRYLRCALEIDSRHLEVHSGYLEVG